MSWTKQLLPKLDDGWSVAAGTPKFVDGVLVHDDTSTLQMYVSSSDINLELRELRIKIKYAIKDTDSLLYPHDNPNNPKIWCTFVLYPTIITDSDDPNYGEPTYFQHINVPAAQSYAYTKKYSSTGRTYVMATAIVPVDTKMYQVRKVLCNLHVKTPCYVQAVSISGNT